MSQEELGEPPMKIIEYFGGEKVNRLAITPEGHEWLRRYVQKKLLASGAIPEDEANPVNPYSIAAQIVYEAWRQFDSIQCANRLIDQAIKFPPSPISEKRFSLRAFIKDKATSKVTR